MSKRLTSATVIFAALLISIAVIGSRYPVLGQPGLLGGSQRLVITNTANPYASVDVLAAMGADGTLLGTCITGGNCLTAYTLSGGYGSWALKVGSNGLGVYFQIQALVLPGGQPKGFVIIKGIGDLPPSSSGTGTVELKTDDPALQAAFDQCALKGPFTYTASRITPD
jgi:hypothetical protein